MKDIKRLIVIICIAATACSGGGEAARDDTTTTTRLTTTTTTVVTATTTTTTLPPDVSLKFDETVPADLADTVNTVFNFLDGETTEPPIMPDELMTFMGDRGERQTGATFAGSTWDAANGDLVGVVEAIACNPETDPACTPGAPRDTLVLVDQGSGWEVVGAKLPSWDLGYWYGEAKTVFVVGSDANFGENQDRARADSIHIFTMVPEARSGAIVGIPRDSWVQGPGGRGKINGILADYGPEALMDTVAGFSGLEFDGYLLTGFTGFIGLIDNFGDVSVDLPKAIDSGVRFQADYPAGEQSLDGERLLWLARIRKTIAGGDLGRSANHGMIMLAGLMQAQPRGILELPWHVRNLTVHVSTDLSTAELAQFGAMMFELDPSTIPNMVLPASVGTVGSASVVFLSSRSEDVYRDLDDGLLSNETDS